ncbi:MAG TPA: hypothetical protein VK742_20445 [Candidatus Sulfotelmatobacter sp.]|jgi:hypothetical protein|nr:hypothetical protein [Candidatus Sulfotelmatobacter sp.]
MNVTPAITITDNVTPELEKLIAKTKPDQLARIARQPLETFTRVHLASNGRNKKGWPSTGFWESASRATTATATGGAVEISINKLGVRQRVLGGHIGPVNAKALAIPISPVSYGHLPREFPGLFIINTPKGGYLVQYGETTTTNAKGATRTHGIGHAGGGNSQSRQRATLNFLFKLVAGVDQAPDPTAVPSADEFTEVAMSAIHRSLAS